MKRHNFVTQPREKRPSAIHDSISFKKKLIGRLQAHIRRIINSYRVSQYDFGINFSNMSSKFSFACNLPIGLKLA